MGPFGAVGAGTTGGLAYDEPRSSAREVPPSSVFYAFKVSLPLAVVVLQSGKLWSCTKKITNQFSESKTNNFCIDKSWETNKSAIPSSIFCS